MTGKREAYWDCFGASDTDTEQVLVGAGGGVGRERRGGHHGMLQVALLLGSYGEFGRLVRVLVHQQSVLWSYIDEQSLV